ncbi:hypothetical protein TSOC_014194, partial [Tetrabaena socialis]
DDGEPLAQAAAQGSVSMLRCLRRLGCPWRPDGGTMTRAVAACRGQDSAAVQDSCRGLRWLLDQGCPVDWTAAESAAWKAPIRPTTRALLKILREERSKRWCRGERLRLGRGQKGKERREPKEKSQRRGGRR